MYNVGDKVIIKEREGSSYDYPYAFVDSMAELSGRIATITDIVKDERINKACAFYNGDDNTYSLNIGSAWNWHSSMFSKMEEYTIEEEYLGTESSICIYDSEGFLIKGTPIILIENNYSDTIGSVDKADKFETYKSAKSDLWLKYYSFRVDYMKLLESHDIVISYSPVFGRIEVRKQKSDRYPFIVKLSDGDVFELTPDFKYFEDSKVSLI